MNQCATLNTANSGAGYAGRTDWRLPTSMEIQSLPNLGTSSPAIDTTYFPATVSGAYWSSSTYASSMTNAPNAWLVDFTGGGSGTSDRANSNYVRCVADGP